MLNLMHINKYCKRVGSRLEHRHIRMLALHNQRHYNGHDVAGEEGKVILLSHIQGASG
jgi:hypothetical protein